MTLIIEPVRTRAQLTEFITLPRRLYRGMPGYVPPLDRERRELLDPRRSPFFSHGIARYWIACDGARALGRVSAQIDHLMPGPEAGEIGMFGCLDAVDDSEVVGALLSAAEEWLHSRGRRLVRGPFLLSINGEPGLLVEGHAEPPVVLLPWHPRYLDAHLRAFGYGRAMGFDCFTADFRNFTHDKRLHQLGGKRIGNEFVVKNLRLGQLDFDAELGRRLYNDAWQYNWGFTPLTESEMQALVRNIRPILFSDSGFLIEYEGNVSAFLLFVPNISELSADLGAAPGLLGWSKFLFRLWRGRYRSVRVGIFGVAAKYRDSVMGARLAAAGLEEWRKRMRAHDVEQVVAGWILENNLQMSRILQSIGFRRSHVYNAYERRLPG